MAPLLERGHLGGQVIKGCLVQASHGGCAGIVFKTCKAAGTLLSFNPCPVLFFSVLLVFCGLLKRDPFSYRVGGFALTQFFLIKDLLSQNFLSGPPYSRQAAHPRG